MKYFSEYENLKFENLEEKGIYPKELIEALRAGKIESILEYLNEKERTDREYMEPIFYAVRKEKNSYMTYKYFTHELQKEALDLAKMVAKNEPKVIKGTAVCNTEEFIDIVEENPVVADYASEELKRDPNYRYQLANLVNDENINNFSVSTLIEINGELANNSWFVIEKISEDVSLIRDVSEELRKDEKFMEEVYKNNMETISFVADHTEDFDESVLETTKDVLIQTANQNAIDKFEKEKIELQKSNEQETNQEETTKNAKRLEAIERHQNFLRKLESGKMDPVRAARLMKILCKDLDEETKKQTGYLLKIDDAIVQREKDKENIREATEGQGLTGIIGATIDLKGQILPYNISTKDNSNDGGIEHGGI